MYVNQSYSLAIQSVLFDKEQSFIIGHSIK